MKHLVVDIQGIDTSSSADNMARALRLLQGVHKAHIDFNAHEAVIEYDENRIHPQEFVTLIQQSGYKAHLAKD